MTKQGQVGYHISVTRMYMCVCVCTCTFICVRVYVGVYVCTVVYMYDVYTMCVRIHAYQHCWQKQFV